jgi:hypothetical protein
MLDKKQIKQHLYNAKGNSIMAESMVSYAVNIIDNVSDNDVYDLIKSIKSDIETNAPVMLDILGVDGFKYFKNFQLPTDFAPVESEGAEA